MLGDEDINELYKIVGSTDVDSELRTAAAAAYGAMNLPSEKVKNLY